MTLINRSFYLKILVFFVLIGVSVAVLRPIQAALTSGMYEVRNNFIHTAEEILGLDIRYSSIRPSVFGSFEIRNLKLYGKGKSIFTVSKISVRFSLPKLIMKNKTAVHTIYIEKPHFNFDIQRDGPVFEEFFKNIRDNDGFENNGQGKLIFSRIAEFLPKKINYKIKDFSFLVNNGDLVIAANGMNIDIYSDNENIHFDSKLDSEIRYSGFKDTSIILSLGIDINGNTKKDLELIEAEVSISSISVFEQKKIRPPAPFFRPVKFNEYSSITNLAAVNPFNISLAIKENEITIVNSENNDNILRKQDIMFFFLYNFESGVMNVNLNIDEYQLGANVKFEDYLKNSNHLLDLILNGSFFYVRNIDKTANYSVNINALYKTEDAEVDSIIINAYGTEKKVFVNELTLNASKDSVKAGLFSGTVSIKGNLEFEPLKPNADILLNNFSFTGKEGINASLSLSSFDNIIEVSAIDIFTGEFKIDDIIVSIFPHEEDMEIYASLICEDDSSIFAEALYSKNQFEAILNMDNFSIYAVTGILRPFIDFPGLPSFVSQPFKENNIDAQIFVSSDFNNFIYNSHDITIKNQNTVLANLSLSGTDRQFNLSRGVFYLENQEVLFSSNADFYNQNDIVFNIALSFQDIFWNIDGQILDRTTLIIRDTNGLHAYGNVSNSGSVSCFIEGLDYPVPFNENPVFLNFYASLRYNDFDFWSCDISYFNIQSLTGQGDAEKFRISGSLDQDGASFREIIYNDDISMLFGNADFAWDPDFSYLQFYINMTDGLENGEFYNFEGIFRDKHISVESNISNMHIHRFIKGRNEIIASMQAKITYDSINDFNGDINITSFDALIRNNNIKAKGSISVTNDEFLAHNISLSYAEITAALPYLHINRDEGFASFGAEVKGILQEKMLDTKADFNASFNKFESWLDYRTAAGSFEGKMIFNNFDFGDISYEDTEFVFSGHEGAILLSGGVDEMIRLDMDNEGNFYLGLSAPMPVRASFAGTLKDFILDAHSGYVFIDLPALIDIASPPNRDFRIDGGFITGKIDIKGPVLNPEFFGYAKGSSFRINVPDFIPESIRPVPFNVAIEGYEMSFGPVVTVCGNGGGITNGWLRFENWGPKNIGIEIDIPRETPIPYNIEIAGFASHGDASGKLDIQTSLDEFLVEIRGDLFANNTEMSIYEFTQEEYVPPKNNSIVDLRIITGPMVEFFWPNINNPLFRANPEMGTLIEVTAESESQSFSVKSDINIRSGELYYLDRNFYIKQGSLSLNENEREFNPYITARAEIRERIDSGPVTISLIIENQPLLSFEPRFEANPGLTQLEIYSFLGQNVNTAGGLENPETAQQFLLSSTTEVLAQVVARSDAIGQFIFMRDLERRARDFFNLDMLSFRTRVFQNAIVYGMTDTVMTASGFEADRTRVGNYFDNTTVSIGKYIGQDMFIQGTATMKYNENNANMGGISFEYDIGIEWRSPFVNIRWDFMPATPQNWFVNDNSITLSWSKTFK